MGLFFLIPSASAGLQVLCVPGVVRKFSRNTGHRSGESRTGCLRTMCRQARSSLSSSGRSHLSDVPVQKLPCFYTSWGRKRAASVFAHAVSSILGIEIGVVYFLTFQYKCQKEDSQQEAKLPWLPHPSPCRSVCMVYSKLPPIPFRLGF